MHKNFFRALIVGFTTVFIDFWFHFFLTKPMETFTYFVIKFLLAFFIATGLFDLNSFIKKHYKSIGTIIIAALIFSTLMSTYYRAWELFEAYAPLGSRAPNIYGIDRTNLLLFSGAWWIGHASFFVIGAFLAKRLIKEKKS